MEWGRRIAVACLAALAMLVATLPLAGSSASVLEGHFRPPCRSGSARLGNRPGRILFQVRCLRRHGHKFGFVIGRGDDRGKHVTISSFSLKPSTRGPGAVYRYGRCQRLRQEVACDAYANGWLTLRGWLAVPASTECSSRIALTEVVPSRCNPNDGHACAADLEVASMFEAPPRGC